jgi:hypothetical protein
MAQKTITVLTDDLDGHALSDGEGETISFSLDGSSYEIDLSTKNATAFRAQFVDYIAVARRVGARSGRAGKRVQSGPSAREVRDWARSNGFDVPDRGRIPANVREAFDAR